MLNRSLVGFVAAVVWTIAVATVPHAAQQSSARPAAVSALGAADSKTVVEKYCVTCHNDRTKTGDLSLEHLNFADVAADAEKFEKVVRKLGVGAMPPQGMPRPDNATHDALVAWIVAELDRAAIAAPNPGRAILRRQNRTEYANAIRDLLDLNVDVSALLPVDNSSYGFDNIADVLGITPVLMERYLTAARRLSAIAVGDPAEIATTQDTYKVRPDLSQDQHIEGLPLGTRGGVVATHTFPLDAHYTFHVNLLQTTVNTVIGLEYPHDVIVTVDGAEVARATVGGKEDLTKAFENSEVGANALDFRLTFRVFVKAGPRSVGAAFVQRSAALRAGQLQPFLKTTFDPVDYTGIPHIQWLTITGPFNQTGPGDTPSRRRIFSCRPATVAEELPCATKILNTIARRAYRRPTTNDDTATLVRFFQEGRKKGSFDAGIELGLRRILASPDFVLRIEREPAGAQPGVPYKVSDLELASRLSFFLWSTIPDETLLQLAASGKLSTPVVLEQQVKRMLADPRAKALVDNFAGQWLHLRNLRSINPDLSEFPDFDHNLRAAMLRELELFFDSIIREDRSIMDLMTANYTFVNERLARHYGIPGIYGSHFRRITIDRDERRGLLGKGAILFVTSFANRTSPVVRGKWILENLMGTPPPPPPPNVPALEDNVAGQKPKTLRERVESHRANPTCANCHRVMDPIGFALEPFDATGAWRATDAGNPIDAAGQLANGVKVDGPVTLRNALVEDPTVFALTMTEKMFIYALGRGLEAHDMPAVRGVVRAAARNNYRFSSLVLGVARSTPFQMRTAASGE